MTGRFIALEGCRNFRDIGGYRTRDGRTVRAGRYFRSDNVDALTEKDLALVPPVRTVIDLRRPEECAGCPIDARYHNISLIPHDESSGPAIDGHLGEVYLWIATGAPQAIAQVFELIGDPDAYPVVVHCAGGKDRTGIVSAFVLDLLGVPDEIIVADYALTDTVRVDEERLAAAFAAVRELGLPEEVLHARPRSMVHFLDGIRATFGSVAAYLGDAGVPEDAIASIRTTLLS